MSDQMDLLVCVDCLFVIAYDEYADMPITRETAIRTGLHRWTNDGFTLHVGDQASDFSTSRCDVCLTDLAGTRHQAWAWDHRQPAADPAPLATPE